LFTCNKKYLFLSQKLSAAPGRIFTGIGTLKFTLKFELRYHLLTP